MLTVTASHASGGNTSAEARIRAAHAVLDHCGYPMSPSKVMRLVRTFESRVAANGFSFFDFFANAIQLDAARRRAMLADPDLALVISYADPTGEAAVRNVMRPGGAR